MHQFGINVVIAGLGPAISNFGPHHHLLKLWMPGRSLLGLDSGARMAMQARISDEPTTEEGMRLLTRDAKLVGHLFAFGSAQD